MGSVFHQLCPRYSGTLTPTAPTAIRLWETFTFLYHRMDEWITCDFTYFLTVFQSYQDDVCMIIKGCVQWNYVYG